jgi:hypothetical protein
MGAPMPEIALKLTIKSGKNAGTFLTPAGSQA